MTQETSHNEEKLAAAEALLFIHGEPLSFKKMSQLLGVSPAELGELLNTLEADLASGRRGLALIRDQEKVQLVTKPEFHGILESFVKEQLSEDLTPAALETLAIIAYFGPLSRARIEYQRGVNSVFILRSLLLRGLIERVSDPDRANSFLYQASFEFLKHLGVTSKEDLPEFEKFKGLLAQFEAQPQS